jgi:hypothetical protein
MSDILIFEDVVGEDGKLVLEIPPDGPRGDVRVTIERVSKSAEPKLTPEEEAYYDAQLEELLSDENLNGLGQTAEEIANAPEVGMLADSDTPDGETYVENLRGYLSKRYTL